MQTEDLDSTPPPAPQDARKEPLPLVWIPATLGVGLAIAAVYLGSRILSGHPSAPVPAPIQTETAVSVAVPPAASPLAIDSQPESVSQPKAEAPKSADSPPMADSLAIIDPQRGEQYIQVSAARVDGARKLVSELRETKLEPHLAPGPTPEMVRVLIGPIANQAALIQAERDLERVGIKGFVRRY